MTNDGTRCGARGRQALLPLLGCLLLLSVPDIVISGQVLFGNPHNARTAAVVDAVTVYANNPAYIRLKAAGLSPSDDDRGRKLFGDAQAVANKALARAATAAGIDVITVPGGVTGGERAIPDLTQNVIDQLPVYYVEGTVAFGNAPSARLMAELDTARALAAIPAWRESTQLTESDANYHFLRRQAQASLEKAVKTAAAEGGYDAVIEVGGVTSRLGPVADLTPAVIAALSR